MKYLQIKAFNKSKGFSILALILVIVVIVVAIGSWTLSGESNTTNLTGNNTAISAAALINDSMAIQNAYDQLLLEGNDYSKIVFLPNTASTFNSPNILDPINGISVPTVNPKLLRSGATQPEGMWIINPGSFMANLGTDEGRDPTIVVVGITDLVCAEINKQLHGNASKIGIGISNFNPSDATAANPRTTAFINLTTQPHMKGIVSACAATTIPDKNFYFRVLKIV